MPQFPPMLPTHLSPQLSGFPRPSCSFSLLPVELPAPFFPTHRCNLPNALFLPTLSCLRFPLPPGGGRASVERRAPPNRGKQSYGRATLRSSQQLLDCGQLPLSAVFLCRRYSRVKRGEKVNLRETHAAWIRGRSLRGGSPRSSELVAARKFALPELRTGERALAEREP